MELNAEQIKKALECCASPQNLCEECPIDQKKKDDCICAQFLAEKALALINSQEQRIKELTEGNERLKARVIEENHLRHQAEEMLANGMSAVKADTVREMLQRIKEDAIAVSLLSNPPKFMLEIREDALDQIAKEMLEGENEN